MVKQDLRCNYTSSQLTELRDEMSIAPAFLDVAVVRTYLHFNH